MLPQMAIFTDPGAEPERRSNTRRKLQFGLDVAAPGGNSDVSVLDVSRTGLLVRSPIPLDNGEIIDIELPQAGLVRAQVARYEDGNFGMQFLNAISEAAVSAVMLNAPAAPRVAEQDSYRSGEATEHGGLEPELNFAAAFAITGLLWLGIATVAYALWF